MWDVWDLFAGCFVDAGYISLGVWRLSMLLGIGSLVLIESSDLTF